MAIFFMAAFIKPRFFFIAGAAPPASAVALPCFIAIADRFFFIAGAASPASAAEAAGGGGGGCQEGGPAGEAGEAGGAGARWRLPAGVAVSPEGSTAGEAGDGEGVPLQTGECQEGECQEDNSESVFGENGSGEDGPPWGPSGRPPGENLGEDVVVPAPREEGAAD